jgi:hypothetical protein
MSTVNKTDVTNVDTDDNGNNADGADDNPPINTQDSSKEEDAGKRKRNHDRFVREGHEAHHSQCIFRNGTANGIYSKCTFWGTQNSFTRQLGDDPGNMQSDIYELHSVRFGPPVKKCIIKLLGTSKCRN